MSRIVLTILAVSFMVSCTKICKEPNYTFSASYIFSPPNDTLNLGDTLWFVCHVPKIQQDVNTGMSVDFSNVESFSVTLIISDISKFNTLRGAADRFDYVLKKGKIETGYNRTTGAIDNEGRQLMFTDSASSYESKVGLIVKKAGCYIFTVPDLPDVFRSGKRNCGRADFEILNENENQHLQIFENKWGSLRERDRRNSYCVVVK